MTIPTPNTTITIKRYLGTSGAGSPVFSVQSDVKAYVEQGFKRVTNQNGEEVVSSAFMILSPKISIAACDFVSIETQNYTVIDVQPVRIFNRIDHLEIYLQSVA